MAASTSEHKPLIQNLPSFSLPARKTPSYAPIPKEHYNDLFFHLQELDSNIRNFEESIISVVNQYRSPRLFYATETKQLFLAADPYNKLVVLKFVSDPFEAANELRALEELNGKCHIVSLYDWKIFDGLNWMLFVLEYQRPITWQPRTAQDVARYATQMLEALNCLHCNLIIHGDIKPTNVVVNAKGNVTLIDFGLAIDRIFAKDVRGYRGTVPYMAPEVLEGNSIGYASDIWSLGVILAEMVLKQKILFDGKNEKEVLAQQLQCNFDLLDTSALGFDLDNRMTHLWQVIKTMLQVDPKNRVTAALAHRMISSLFGDCTVCSKH